MAPPASAAAGVASDASCRPLAATAAVAADAPTAARGRSPAAPSWKLTRPHRQAHLPARQLSGAAGRAAAAAGRTAAAAARDGSGRSRGGAVSVPTGGHTAPARGHRPSSWRNSRRWRAARAGGGGAAVGTRGRSSPTVEGSACGDGAASRPAGVGSLAAAAAEGRRGLHHSHLWRRACADQAVVAQPSRDRRVRVMIYIGGWRAGGFRLVADSTARLPHLQRGVLRSQLIYLVRTPARRARIRGRTG